MAKSVNWSGFNPVKYGVIGAIAGLWAFLVSWIVTFFKIPIFNHQGSWYDFTAAVVKVDLRQEVLQTGRFKDIGVKFLEFLQGQFNLSFFEFAGVLVGAILVLFAGRTLVGFMGKGKTLVKLRVFFSFLIGGAVVGLIAPVWLGLSFATTFASLTVYGFALGVIMQMLVNFKGLKWLNEGKAT